jgi:hypothetical protein
MAKAVTDIILPTEIGARVRVQSADSAGFRWLGWRGFYPEIIEVGGWITMRRDFPDETFAVHYSEPTRPRFSMGNANIDPPD